MTAPKTSRLEKVKALVLVEVPMVSVALRRRRSEVATASFHYQPFLLLVRCRPHQGLRRNRGRRLRAVKVGCRNPDYARFAEAWLAALPELKKLNR